MAPKKSKRATVVPTLASRRSRRTIQPVERYGFPSPSATPASTPTRRRRRTTTPATPKKRKATPPTTPKKKVTKKAKTPAAPNDKAKFAPTSSSSPSPGTPPPRKSTPTKAVPVFSGLINKLGKLKGPPIKVESISSSPRSPPAGTLFFGKPIKEACSRKSPPVKVEKKSPSKKQKSSSPGLFVSPTSIISNMPSTDSSSSADNSFPNPDGASWERERHSRYFRDEESHRNLDDENSFWHRTFQEAGNVDAAWTAWCQRYLLAQCGCPYEHKDTIRGGKHIVTGYDRFQFCSNPASTWHRRFTDIYKDYSYLDRKKYYDEE